MIHLLEKNKLRKHYKIMKAALLSDTHGYNSLFLNDLKNDPVDIVIHAGDFSNLGTPQEIEAFDLWIDQLEGTNYFIFIGGNHDFGLKGVEPYERTTKNGVKVHYLYNSSVEIQGKVIYGSPNTPEFFNWAFMYPRNSEEGAAIWDQVPEETHTLITHGPRYKVLDMCSDFKSRAMISVGCDQLGKRIDKLPKLKNHIFGHIHPAHGYKTYNGVHYYNVAMSRDFGGFRKPVMTFL
jgi:Icc-related predicted phosphoesterase